MVPSTSPPSRQKWGPVDTQDYLRVLRSRWRLVVVAALLGLAAGAAATALSSVAYEARAQLFVSTPGEGAAGLQQGGQFAQQRVKSYAEVIDSPMVTQPVIAQLGLGLSPTQLADKIEASAPLNTVLIDVTVRDSSPVGAQRIANAVAQQFSTVVDTLERSSTGDAPDVKVSVVREAELPGAAVSPRPPLNLALGLLVGLAVGVGAALLQDVLDTTVKGPTEIQDRLGLPTLGLITFDQEAAKRPLIVQSSPHSSRAEAFRQLRTNLQFIDVDNPPSSIVLTSALPQEGKSTTTCNLAIALGQAGLRVALVEGDLRRPRLAEYLGIEGAVGLTDVLVGRAGLEDVLQPWGDGQLVVLPSGPTPPNPSELLGSQQMQDLLKDLEGRVDLVLLDAPPLLPVTDGAILASQASGAIVVLRSGRTTREQAQRATETLRDVGAHIYGVVLNMVPASGPSGYGYGYYGYGHNEASSADTLAPVRVATR